MRYLIILILLSAFTRVNAQIYPGYQGKKGIISYQVSISPALTRPTYLNRVKDDDAYPNAEETMFYTPFNFTHGLNFERVLGRKFALGFDYNFVATKDYVNYTQRVRDGVTNLDQTYQFRDAQINIFGHYFIGSMIFYGKRSLAPFGKYFKISVGHAETFSSFTDANHISVPNPQNNPYIATSASTKSKRFKVPSTSFGFSFGMNRIYHNRLVISRGISYSYFVMPYYREGDEDNAIQMIGRRMRGHDLLTFYLRIGFLM